MACKDGESRLDSKCQQLCCCCRHGPAVVILSRLTSPLKRCRKKASHPMLRHTRIWPERWLAMATSHVLRQLLTTWAVQASRSTSTFLPCNWEHMQMRDQGRQKRRSAPSKMALPRAPELTSMCFPVLHGWSAKRKRIGLAVRLSRATDSELHEVAQRILLVHLDLALLSQGHPQLARALKAAPKRRLAHGESELVH